MSFLVLYSPRCRHASCALPGCEGAHLGEDGDARCPDVKGHTWEKMEMRAARMCRVTLGRKWRCALPGCAGSRSAEDGDARCPDVPGHAWEKSGDARCLDVPGHAWEKKERCAARMCRVTLGRRCGGARCLDVPGHAWEKKERC